MDSFDPVYATDGAHEPRSWRQLELRERPRGRRPVMAQSWRHLLFLHWRFDRDVVARTLPPGLEAETFDGSAWIGIVPFFMRRVRPYGLPALPYLSDFLELNVRTYAVDRDGRPGVWFYSLDANRRLAVSGARAVFHLPYRNAEMEAEAQADGWVDYRSRRRGVSPAPVSRFRYRPRGPALEARPRSLEFFLIERYLLFSHHRGRLFTGRVHHSPYPLQEVDVPAWNAEILELDGLRSPARPPDHAIYAAGVDVAVFALEHGGA